MCALRAVVTLLFRFFYTPQFKIDRILSPCLANHYYQYGRYAEIAIQQVEIDCRKLMTSLLNFYLVSSRNIS